MKAPESYAEFLALPDAEREELVKSMIARSEPKPVHDPHVVDRSQEPLVRPLRIPKAHAKHGKIPCGCWTGSGPAVSCTLCGASYDPMEVMEFPGWRCYDCGQGSWPANINFKPNPTGLRSPRLGGDKQDPVVRHLN